MPLDPQLPLPQPIIVAPPPMAPAYRWYHLFWAFLFIFFCMALGTALLLLPWTEFWDHNFFSSLVPEWHRFWENSYIRGAVSGLGVVNFYISFLEIVRLRRFARR